MMPGGKDTQIHATRFSRETGLNSGFRAAKVASPATFSGV